jgi:hypothetical protein
MKKKYFKAQKGKSAGSHPYTAEDMKRVSWCINNNIRIATIPVSGGWSVEINLNGSINLDPKTYNGYDAQTKMYEYYKYYYDKHNK